MGIPSRRRAKLKGLSYRKIALCAQGANPGATITLMKKASDAGTSEGGNVAAAGDGRSVDGRSKTGGRAPLDVHTGADLAGHLARSLDAIGKGIAANRETLNELNGGAPMATILMKHATLNQLNKMADDLRAQFPLASHETRFAKAAATATGQRLMSLHHHPLAASLSVEAFLGSLEQHEGGASADRVRKVLDLS